MAFLLFIAGCLAAYSLGRTVGWWGLAYPAVVFVGVLLGGRSSSDPPAAAGAIVLGVSLASLVMAGAVERIRRSARRPGLAQNVPPHDPTV